MASKFTDFLFSLSDDPNLVQEFEKNPNDVMDKAGLSADEKNMILNRDVQGIRNHLLTDPDLQNAMGITPGSPRPKKLPMCVFIPKP
ncbi:MAG TPA: hypothetical protein VEH81_02105 [Ktedonobacteraceae bacterium]|nr:hypothetical protein [Ktedonobacteraceae bacterium]